MEPRPDAGPEWLDTGPPPGPEAWWRRWPLWLAVAALVALVGVAIARSSGNPGETAPHRDAASTPGDEASNAPSDSPPPVVVDAGHSILGVTASYELYGHGQGVVVRVQLSRGRVEYTRMPEVKGTGSVSFFVTDSTAVIRPFDFAPGYAVPDEQGARPLTGVLADHGPAVPGSGPGLIWVASGPPAGPFVDRALTLVGLSGTPIGPTVRLPAESGVVRSDGQGGAVVGNRGGVSILDGSRFRRFTSEALLGVGGDFVLTGRCDGRSCQPTLWAGGERAWPKPQSIPDPRWADGALSPNGRYAALLDDDPTGTGRTLTVYDLYERRRTVQRPHLVADLDASVLAWAPDDRWLFLVTKAGAVAALDPVTGRLTDLEVTLPPVQQLAVKP